jgi:hypothetical protein
VKVINGSGNRAEERAAVQCGGRRDISSIFAKLGHNEHPATHRRLAAVLNDLGAASR